MKRFNRSVFPSKGPKGIVLALTIALAGIGVLSWLISDTREINNVTYSQFLDLIEENKVEKVHVTGQDVQGKLKDGSRFETVVVDSPQMWDMLRAHNVMVAVDNLANQFNFWHLLFLGSLILFFIFVWQFIRQARSASSGGGPGGIFNMGKSKARMFPPSAIKEKFSSVAGVHEAKEELQDVVDFLKNPDKYKSMGAKIPRGVLLVGEPGNGKTLLARAVAGEANCPFFSISGSDFIEVFVGVGASRVRDLFEQARSHAPCIVFIDEIDAVGRHRGRGMGGGHDEREQTLNQLLTEMDGFLTYKKPVIVLAATNRSDVLDKALLRPGRFDRIVHVPYPDQKSREQILQVHSQSVKLDPTIDLAKVARATSGFSGADLANLINEAAINASKAGKTMIDVHDLEEAHDKILIGKVSKSKMLTDEDKRVTAYHEAGHALIRLLMPLDSDPLHKVTIIPRGHALGVTSFLPEREKYTSSKDEMISSIMAALGGRAAEELIFNKLMTGAASDFRAATAIARSMVCDYGMSEKLGPVVYSQEYGQQPYSESTARLIDEEVRRILDECQVKVREMLSQHKDKLDKLAQLLIEKETVYAGEVYELLGIEPRTELKLS
ncbi:MAG TPA: ATP-dependent zinc metalloprotease FtsH [Candidatus Babeliales bacterium]|jgi:cell division protease FtsH|nr:ATP-dependent zinc metalloprotease FtsH [Candidatus Babeliales bacterium]